MELDANRKKVFFRCRSIRGKSCCKLNSKEINEFKENNFEPKKVPFFNITKKKKMLKIQLDKGQEENICISPVKKKKSEEEDDYFNDGDSKITEKKHSSSKSSCREILQKLDCDQERILSLLEEVMGKKLVWIQNGKDENFTKNLEDFKENVGKNKLKIKQVFNQKLGVSTLPQPQHQLKGDFLSILTNYNQENKENSHNSTSGEVKVIPFLTRIINHVLSQPPKSSRAQTQEQMLKKLISLRIYGKDLSYSSILEILLDYQEQIPEKELRRILKETPWSLKSHETQILLKHLFSKYHKSSLSKQIKISDIAQCFRKFIQDYPKLTTIDRELKIVSLKKFLTLKKKQIEDKLKDQCGLNVIHINKLKDILIEFRLTKEQIYLFLANICLYYDNITSLPYLEIFNPKWISQMQ